MLSVCFISVSVAHTVLVMSESREQMACSPALRSPVVMSAVVSESELCSVAIISGAVIRCPSIMKLSVLRVMSASISPVAVS